LFGGNFRIQGGNSGVDKSDIFELVLARRDAGGMPIYLLGFQQIEDGKLLDGEHAIHCVEAQSALGIEKVADMRLAETATAGEFEAGEDPCINAGQQEFAQPLLESTKRQISPKLSNALNFYFIQTENSSYRFC